MATKRPDTITNVSTQINSQASEQLTASFVFEFLNALNCPRSLSIWLLFSNGESEQLRDIPLKPEDYRDAEHFRSAYLASCLLAKASFLPGFPEKKRKDLAIEKFLKYETQCARTNRRFIDLSSATMQTARILSNAQRKIQSILGDFDASEFVDNANWGKGASLNIKGDKLTPPVKFQFENGISRDWFTFSESWIGYVMPRNRWNDKSFLNLTSVNQLTTVPKNAFIERVIAMEPGINLFYQKSIGTMIRKRLRYVGIDLKHGQQKHQKLARLSSITGDLATIDFSSASDSIAKNLVNWLLPSTWFSVMDALRSKGTHVDDQYTHYMKFSSMGNGFTFELESLIFYAIACATCEELGIDDKTVSIYGDDVIIDTRAVSIFSESAIFCGFTFNNEKSFSTGYFRESCGSHYYDGIDCKPFYLKDRISDIYEIYKCLNGARRIFSESYRQPGPWKYLLNLIPRKLRFFGPTLLGDRVIHGDRIDTSITTRDGWNGFYVRCLSEVPIQHWIDYEGLLTSKLWSLHQRPTQGLLNNPLPDTISEPNCEPFRGRTKRGISNTFVHYCDFIDNELMCV